MSISATLSVQATSQRMWDAVIVGAGPAGAMAALHLARCRFSVLLVDRSAFPRWKVCGCCLNGHALALLHEAGMTSSLTRLGAVPLHNIRLAKVGKSAEVPLTGGLALSREVFDAELIAAAIGAGADFLPQTMASLPAETVEPNFRCVELRQGSHLARAATRVVIAADGLGGNLLVRAGYPQSSIMPQHRIGAGVVVANAPAFYSRGVIFMACGRHGYLGAVRLEDNRLNLAAAFDPCWMRKCGGLGYAAARLLAEVGWPTIAHLVEQGWRGTPSLTRRARRRAAPRLFAIGDAAGYIEPFTGEGIAWALTSGKTVAAFAAQAVHSWNPALARQWEATYQSGIGRRQRVCYAVAAVLRCSWLTGAIIRLLALTPAFAVPLTRYLGAREKEPANAAESLSRGRFFQGHEAEGIGGR